MIEHDHFAVLKLCDLLEQLRQCELKFARVNYRIAYLRKIKTAILTRKGTPDGFQKWKNDLRGLNREIDNERARALDVRHANIIFKKSVRAELNARLNDADASLVFSDGKQVGIMIGDRDTFISTEKIPEMADQYEAAVAMDAILDR